MDPGGIGVAPEQNGNRAEHRRGAPDPISRPKRAHTVRPRSDSPSVGQWSRIHAHTAKGDSLGHVGSDECEERGVQSASAKTQGQGVHKGKGRAPARAKTCGPRNRQSDATNARLIWPIMPHSPPKRRVGHANGRFAPHTSVTSDAGMELESG